MLLFISQAAYHYLSVAYRFNTSHVVVYPEIAMWKEKQAKFQYISCCCLSRDSMGRYSRDGSFNTSHVVVYRLRISSIWRHRLRFNTSHVVVYLIELQANFATNKFQYISCCCLSPICPACFSASHTVSIHLMLLFIISPSNILVSRSRFNTSHVVVYLTHLRHFSISLSPISPYFSSFFHIFTRRCPKFPSLFHNP